MTASHGVQHVYAAGVALTYPFVVAQLHSSYAELGIVLAVAGAVSGVLQGAAGLVRRTAARTLLSAQNLFLAVASVLGAVAPGFAAFGAARCFASLVNWPQHPVGSAYLSERFPDRRGTVLSWHTAGGSLGTVMVPLVASVIIAHWGWRWALVALALPMAAGAVLVWTRLPLDRGHRRDEGHPEARPVPAVPLRALLKRRTVLAVLAASTIAAAGRGLGVLTAYIPAYLRSGLHLAPLTVGVIYTVVVVGAVVGPVVAGSVSDRIGRRPVLLVAYLAGAAAMVGFVSVGANLVALAGTGVALGVLAYAESPLMQSLFSDATEGADGRAAFGMFYAIAYGVGSVWLVVIGALIDDVGFTAAFGAMAASFLVAAGIVASLRLPHPDRS